MTVHPSSLSAPVIRSRRGGTLLRLTIVTALVAGMGVGAWAIWGRDRGGEGAGRIELSPVSRSSFDITTTCSGELEAKNQIEIRSKLEAQSTIVEIVAEGTRVKTGELLVRLNTDQLKTQLEQAELDLTLAKAKMTAAEHAYESQQIDNDQKLRAAMLKLDLAELDYNQWLEGDVKTKRQANQLALSKSGLEVDRLAEKLKQSYDLREKGFLSRDEYDRDVVSYIEAQSAWITATLQTEIFETFEFQKTQKKHLSGIDDATANVAQVKLNNQIQLDAKNADRDNEKKTVELRDSRKKKLEEQVASATIKAPNDGLVVFASSMGRFMFGAGGDGPMAIGRQVFPNEQIMQLPDTSEMLAVVRVHESLADKIRKGQRATVKVDAVGGKSFPGIVDSIGVLAENSNWRDPNLKEYTVKIALEKSAAEAGLKPSMRCEAQLLLDRAEEVVTIPAQSVFSEGPVRFVYVPEGLKFRRNPIKLGRQSDTTAEIISGLEPGSRVLTRQPTPGEILRGDWDVDGLKLAGYDVDAEGKPVLAKSGGMGGMGGKGGMKVMAAAPAAPKPPDGVKPAETAAAPESKPVVPAGEAKPTSSTASTTATAKEGS